MASGMLGFLGLGKETAYGTPVSATDYVAFEAESIQETINFLRTGQVRARFAEPPKFLGMKTIAGDIAFDAHPIALGFFLRSALGGYTAPASAGLATHVFTPTASNFSSVSPLPPYTVEVHRDVSSSWRYTSALAAQIGIEVGANRIVRATATIVAKDSTLIAKSTPSFPTGSPFSWDVASVSLGGAASGIFEALRVTIANPIEGLGTLDASKLISRVRRTAHTQIRVAGVIDFDDQTEYEKFRDGTERRLAITFTSVPSNQLILDIPSFFYQTFPANISGPARISVAFDGGGEYNTGSGTALTVTLTNTKTTY
ncbi:MAG: phage tail tube protein [Acidobacteriota bacterium]